MSGEKEAIERILAQARGGPQAPDALMARVVADGLRMQPARVAAPQRRTSWLSDFLGGWQTSGGLAGAAVFGLMVGYLQPFDLVTNEHATETYDIFPEAAAGFDLLTGE